MKDRDEQPNGRDAEGKECRMGPRGEVPSVVLVYLSVLTSLNPSCSPEKLSCAWVPEHSAASHLCLCRASHSLCLACPPLCSHQGEPHSALLPAPQGAFSDAHTAGANLALLWAPLLPEPARESCCIHVAVAAVDFGGAVPVVPSQVLAEQGSESLAKCWLN